MSIHDYWNRNAAALKSVLAENFDIASASDEEIKEAAPDFFASKSENECAAAIKTIRAPAWLDVMNTGHAGIVTSTKQAELDLLSLTPFAGEKRKILHGTLKLTPRSDLETFFPTKKGK